MFFGVFFNLEGYVSVIEIIDLVFGIINVGFIFFLILGFLKFEV